jgi:catecholate siderophore receptor
MAFIKTRKKIVSSALLSVMASATMAEDVALDTIHSQADIEAQKSLKVDQSANTKLVAPLLDTPKSVSVISKQLIQDTQVTTLADALRTVPGVTLGSGEGGNPNGDRPFIRGYNAEGSIYVDGVRGTASQNREMFAVEQVEVTKGSASALGGGGNAGGNINMVSKVAKKGDALTGSVAQGTDDYQRINLDGNKDFGNGIAARVALMGHQNDKAGQNDGAEYKRVGIAPSISFGLDSDTRATLSYYYLKSDDIPDSGVPYNNPRTYTAGTGEPIHVKQGIFYGWKDRDFQKQENHIGTIKLEHDLTDNLTISNVATYSNSKNDYVWTQPDDSAGNFISATGELKDTGVWRRANTRTTDIDTFSDQLSLRGKFNTGSLQHSFNTGAEYSKLDGKKGTFLVTDSSTSAINSTACNVGIAASNGWCASTFNPKSGVPFLGSIVKNPGVTGTKTETTAFYLIDNIKINSQWLLDLGVRWDKFETELTSYKTSSTPLAQPTSVDSDSTYWSWNAGLTFKPTENGAIYASYATSATPVGIDSSESSESAPSAAIKDLDPEEARTIEVGTKWDILNQRANVTAAVFRTEKTNTRVLVAPGLTMNAGESEVNGFELGLNGNLTDKWAIAAGYSYLDSELTKAAYNAKANEGLPLPNVPKNSATLWTTYQVLPSFTLGGGATYMDKVFGAKTSTSQKWVSDYVRYDAMARYNVNKNVDLQLNVNNLSDERYFTKAYGSHYATEAEGRSAVVSLNFNY